VRRALGLIAHPCRIRARLEVAADARRFDRAHSFLERDTPGSRSVALAVSLTEWPYQLKLEGMLLKALELEGLRPLVLTSAALPRGAASYHRTFGFERAELERFVPTDSQSALRHEAAALLAGDLSVQRLKRLEYRGVNVGQHVLSTLSRNLFRGSVTLDDPESQAVVERLLPESMALALTGERVLDELRPDVVMFNEARYAGYGPLFETALQRGLNVIQFVHAFSDDAFAFKRYTAATSRVHPRSLGDSAWSEVKAGPWSTVMEAELSEQFDLRYAGKDLLSRRLHEHTRRRGRDELATELGLDPAKPSAVLFSHILWDANLFYGDDLFEDQEEWLIETIRSAAANPHLNWIVKLHPANVWKRKLEGQTGELPELEAIRSKLGELPPHVRLLLPDTDVSTLSLFELADFAITIRGTVGVEAPVFGVPVVTGGTSHYSGRGFTLDSATADEYRALLARLHEQPRLTEEQVLLAKKHAHALFCRRPLHFSSFRSVIDLESRGPFSHDLELTVSSRAELEAAPDLREFARWAVDRSREDYLRPLSDDVVVDEHPRALAPDDAAGSVEQAGRAQR
jgi:hypothetical protein